MSVQFETERPNIVFLMSDDQRAFALGAMGDAQIHTPRLDALAHDGVLFEVCYATSPLCMASRASVMTGMQEYKTGCNFLTGKVSVADWRTLGYPVLLRRAGYRTAFAGKWGFPVAYRGRDPEGTGARRAGKDFDRWGALTGGQGYYQTARNANLAHYADEYPHVTRALGAFGRDFIRDSVNNGTQPFCLSISFKAPHEPHDVIDAADASLYEGVTFPQPASFGDEGAARLPIQAKTGRQYARRDAWGPDNYQHHLRRYYQLISGIDDAVGVIIDELERQGVADNTVVIYTSDNGYFCGAHGLSGKVLPYDDASRIPLIIHDPRRPSPEGGRRSTAVVGTIDFAPTMLDLGGVTIPRRMDGRSLVPLLDDPRGRVRDHLGLVQNWDWTDRDLPKGLAVAAEGLKYIVWCYADGNVPPSEELFDLHRDPEEMHNVLDDPAYADELAAIRAAYDEFHRHWSAECVAGPHYERYRTIFDRHVAWQEKDYRTEAGRTRWRLRRLTKARQAALEAQYEDLTGERYPS